MHHSHPGYDFMKKETIKIWQKRSFQLTIVQIFTKLCHYLKQFEIIWNCYTFWQKAGLVALYLKEAQFYRLDGNGVVLPQNYFHLGFKGSDNDNVYDQGFKRQAMKLILLAKIQFIVFQKFCSEKSEMYFWYIIHEIMGFQKKSEKSFS